MLDTFQVRFGQMIPWLEAIELQVPTKKSPHDALSKVMYDLKKGVYSIDSPQNTANLKRAINDTKILLKDYIKHLPPPPQ